MKFEPRSTGVCVALGSLHSIILQALGFSPHTLFKSDFGRLGQASPRRLALLAGIL
jgi:hypothetical protein